jgi:hypothetical protein
VARFLSAARLPSADLREVLSAGSKRRDAQIAPAVPAVHPLGVLRCAAAHLRQNSPENHLLMR